MRPQAQLSRFCSENCCAISLKQFLHTPYRDDGRNGVLFSTQMDSFHSYSAHVPAKTTLLPPHSAKQRSKCRLDDTQDRFSLESQNRPGSTTQAKCNK